MAFIPGIRTINRLATDQLVTSSVTPVDVAGFSFVIPPSKSIKWKVRAVFTLGATGGFRFLAHNTAAPAEYNFECTVRDLTTPATITGTTGGALVEAAFANASAVASNYQLEAEGFVTANAAGGTFSFQFAQNTSDVLPITMQAGATMELIQF